MGNSTIGMEASAAIGQPCADDLRREMAQSMAVALAVGALLGTLTWVTREEPYSCRFWVILGAVAASAPAAVHLYFLGARRPSLASLLLVGGLFATVTAAMLAFSAPDAAYFYVLPVIACTALLGPVAGALCTAAAALTTAFASPASGAWGGPTTLAVSAAIAVWLALRLLQRTLVWSWAKSAESIRLAEELRDERGKLNRTMKALELTNRLLQRSNHELGLARREAEEARRLKEEFCASISHELRTPLNIVLGFAEIMHGSPHVYGDMTWPRPLQRDIAEIHRNAGYISSMVDDILDLARVEAMRMPLRREQAAIGEVIEEAAGIARQLLRDTSVSLVVQVPPGLPYLPIDKVRIRQVLLNLLANAGRHTERGSVTVTAEQRIEELVVAVSDTGTGIPADELGFIFDEFRQANAWGRSAEAGKGLGLAVAKRFVQMHGGRIWAESEVGHGSTFRFALPLERKDVSRLTTGTPAPLPASPYEPCVIVLDDGDAARAYLHRHLDGYEVLQACQPEALSELAFGKHPHAVIVNETAGFTVATAMSAVPGIPIIGCQLPARPTIGSPRPVSQVLTKPVTGERLLVAVEKVAPQGEVLIIDDDRGFVEFVARLLQSAGRYRVRRAYNGRDGIARMYESRPDVAILDMTMPEMGGEAVLEEIAADEALATVPVLVVTGTGDPLDGRHDWGTCLHLARATGFGEGELLALINGSLEHLRPGDITEESALASP